MYEELVNKIRVLTEQDTRIGLKTQEEAADAIEELQKQVEDYECRLEISPEAEYAIDKHCNDIISRMDKLIKGLDDKPRWISVEERLPEKNGKTLVYDLRFGIGSAFFCYDSWDDMDNVTHWMPLPEPPKE